MTTWTDYVVFDDLTIGYGAKFATMAKYDAAKRAAAKRASRNSAIGFAVHAITAAKQWRGEIDAAKRVRSDQAIRIGTHRSNPLTKWPACHAWACRADQWRSPFSKKKALRATQRCGPQMRGAQVFLNKALTSNDAAKRDVAKWAPPIKPLTQ